MRPRVFLDTNLFIYAFEFPRSNSKKIVDLLNQNKFEAIISEADILKNLALKVYRKSRIEPRDALHIASACFGKAEYFITCDNEIIKKAKKIEKDLKELGYNIKIYGVLDFIEEVKE
jgi:predicted nucleic acid-binding protein